MRSLCGAVLTVLLQNCGEEIEIDLFGNKLTGKPRMFSSGGVGWCAPSVPSLCVPHHCLYPHCVCAPLKAAARQLAGTEFCCCGRYLGGKIELVIKGKKVPTTAADVLLVVSTLLALPMCC